MSKGDKKESATTDAAKSKSESVTQSTTKQLSDLKSSNANNTIMLRNMNGSLRSIDQKLEDILFSQERMENILNRMIMDKGASKRSNLGETNLQDSYEDDEDDDNNLDLDLDIGRKRKRIPRRPRPRPRVRPGLPRPGISGALFNPITAGIAGAGVTTAGAIMGSAALGDYAESLMGTKEKIKERESTEEYKELQKTQQQSAEKAQNRTVNAPEKRQLIEDALKKNNTVQKDVVSLKNDIITLKDGRKINIKDGKLISSGDTKSANDEEYDADIEKSKPTWEQKNPDGTWKNKFTGPDGKEITDPEERKKFQSSRGKDLANKIAGKPVTPASPI
jgi:hypothetical protein